MSRGRLVGVAVVLAAAACGVVLVRRLSEAGPPVPSSPVQRGTVAARAQATGRIVPHEEIYVRPMVPGLLAEVRVRPGDRVVQGQQIATVRVLADPIARSDAASQLEVARVRLDFATREAERLRSLAGRGTSAVEIDRATQVQRVAETDVRAATERLRLVVQGGRSNGGERSTRIVATSAGTVLAVPVVVGDYVSETSSFRDGTIIAVVADMTRLLFKGQLDEIHVGKVDVGRPATVRVGAMPTDRSRAR